MDEDEEEIITNPFDEDELEELEPTYRTYRMDLKNKRILGKVDELAATIQATYKALETRRFAHIIYDDQYGCDIWNKIGSSSLTEEYLDSDIPAMVTDALSNDESIVGVSDIDHEMVGEDGVHLTFSIATIWGDADMEGVITDG